MVRGHEELVEELELPDPDDRHVLATAIRAGAQWIVTHNVKDFPSEVLGGYRIEVRTPDQLVVELLQRTPDMVLDVVRRQAMLLRNPPQTFEDLLEILERQGLTQGVSQLRRLSSSQGSGSPDF
ncbi:MAG: PIN domain-containing protein [Deltaproteobacteria bacterium]|nr:PIN domain-containing protein [Deltaproteobacteria bacterium]